MDRVGLAKRGDLPDKEGPLFLPVRFRLDYRLTALGVSQSGKKVLASIFDVCPLVALLLGRKYGLLPGGIQGSPIPPHAYPCITPLDASL